MGGWAWWLAAVSLAGSPQSTRDLEAARVASRQDDLVRIAQRATSDTVRQALEGAAQRLESGRCRGLLHEFVDSTGRSLQEALDLTGYTPGGYLRQILFYDGSHHPLCESGRVLAIAHAGSRAVQICPEAFRSRYRKDPRYVEAILIHEALHTLGLGENPPSSFEITTRVIRRCGR